MAAHHGVEMISANGANGVRLRVSGDVDMATAGMLLDTILTVAQSDLRPDQRAGAAGRTARSAHASGPTGPTARPAAGFSA